MEAKTIKIQTVTNTAEPLSRFSSLPRAISSHSLCPKLWKTHPKKSNLIYRTYTRRNTISKKLHHNLDTKTLFPDNYTAILNKLPISPLSKLLTLTPFLDCSGIIWDNGRLEPFAALTYNERNPILLPCESKLAKINTELVHKTTLHGGNHLMTRVIRTEFLIFRLKPLQKKYTQSHIMASLPPDRTTTISRSLQLQKLTDLF